MKIADLTIPELRRALDATKQTLGDDAIEVRVLTRELNRRARRPKDAGPTEPDLCTLSDLARELRLPAHWLKAEAQGGRLPHIAIAGQPLFNLQSVKAALCHRAITEGLHGDSALIDFLLAEGKGAGHDHH